MLFCSLKSTPFLLKINHRIFYQSTFVSLLRIFCIAYSKYIVFNFIKNISHCFTLFDACHD